MPNHKLFMHIKKLLHQAYKGASRPNTYLVVTLAWMITGLFFGRHVQLWQIAAWVPLNIQLLSIVRRFERWVANPEVEMKKFFKPFVLAMQHSLGNETAYLIIDCTQAGKKCRTLLIGLAYHGTVLPIVWKTVKGSKGHVTGELQKALLEQVYAYFCHYKHVVVLGDAEFSNEQVIRWLRKVKWDFVFRFQSSYLLQLNAGGEWKSTKVRYQAINLQAGQTHHWEKVAFTESHQFADLTVTVQWDKDEKEPICLVSTFTTSAQPHLIYEKRFWIETLFGNHKSRGFQLARTHMTIPEHIDRLVLAIAIATCLVLGLGTHLILIQDTKQVDRADRRDLSLFQLGWRWFFRLLALDELDQFKMVFSWGFKLPPAGSQWAY